MKEIKVLLCMLSLVSLAALTACDDDDDDGGGGGTNAVAPASLEGRTAHVTINSGSAPFAESGEYTLSFLDGSNYVINDLDGNEVSTGTYTYTPNGDETATLVMEDSALGTVNATLTFDSATTGTIQSTDASGGFEDSTFVLD
jgi:hypothetical protein